MSNQPVVVSHEKIDIRSSAERLDDNVNGIIRKNALLATGAGLIPILGLDVAAMTMVQTKMVKEIATAYGISIPHDEMNIVLRSLIAGIVTRLSAAGIRNTLNSFAEFGNLADELTNAAVSGLFAALSGEVYKNHFSKGGSLQDLKLSHFWEFVQEKMNDGTLSSSNFGSVQSAFRYLT